MCISRENIVAWIWKSAGIKQLELQHLSPYSWTKYSEMVWMEQAFQVKVKNLHIELNNSENEDTNDELCMDTDIDE